jgi:pyridinium-3,5-biscarboxylic acid mononucleotide sulfurtransferase
MDAKFQTLMTLLQESDRLLVAFSAGVDSTFLLKAAHLAIGARVIALTASSASVPPGELDAARSFAASLGCRHLVLESHELDNPSYSQNPVNRCFFCKDELYRICRREADKMGVKTIVDGTNLDDLKDHRPGLKAADEWGVRHPLVETEMTKDDIRRYSRQLNLPTWNKPSSPCLSSRFPYGTEINLERLKKIAECEMFLKELNFREFRVRFHGDLARIEVAQNEIDRLLEKPTREAIVTKFKRAGFSYVSVDLQGFRSGSLNETVVSSGLTSGPFTNY